MENLKETVNLPFRFEWIRFFVERNRKKIFLGGSILLISLDSILLMIGWRDLIISASPFANFENLYVENSGKRYYFRNEIVYTCDLVLYYIMPSRNFHAGWTGKKNWLAELYLFLNLIREGNGFSKNYFLKIQTLFSYFNKYKERHLARVYLAGYGSN